jgi:hypothetical protein
MPVLVSSADVSVAIQIPSYTWRFPTNPTRATEEAISHWRLTAIRKFEKASPYRISSSSLSSSSSPVTS